MAVVEGVFLTSSGRIDMPLVADRGDGRHGVARILSQGFPAVTHFEVIESFGQVASQVACRFETGRTHQIRIYLAEIGHQVVVDPVYRPRSGPKFPVPFPRQALHAQALGFLHPLTEEAIRVEAPLPPTSPTWSPNCDTGFEVPQRHRAGPSPSSLRAHSYWSQCREIILRVITHNVIIILCLGFATEQVDTISLPRHNPVPILVLLRGT